MNILILGNGFDLAHGLPTKYGDFINAVIEKTDFYNFVVEDPHFSKKIFNCVQNSMVFKFMKNKLESNDGWIDFENELREIVDSICSFPNFLDRFTYMEKGKIKVEFRLSDEKIHQLSPFLYHIIGRTGTLKKIWTQNEINVLEDNIFVQIKNFINLFAEYIVWITEQKMNSVSPLDFFRNMKIDHLLSFNYTKTFLNLYNTDEKLIENNICFVHGKIDTQFNSGIVMGIGSDFYDENKHEKFVDFFKFFQCYKYSTSTNYLRWIQKYTSAIWDSKFMATKLEDCIIHIYGHSLDPTDKNILKPFFDLNNSTVYIYYLNTPNKEQLEHNLLKILGKNTFSDYLAGEHPKVHFKQIQK